MHVPGRIRLFLTLLLMILSGLLSGCGLSETDSQKVEDLPYEIVEKTDFPEELQKKIDEKKASRFTMTFDTQEYLYLVKGYGRQSTGGYSIQALECYRTSNAICFRTRLCGPRKDQTVVKTPSYPYIVIRIKSRKEPALFYGKVLKGSGVSCNVRKNLARFTEKF